MKRRDKKSLPFAVCTKNVGRENKAKYERCVMKVKKSVNEGKLCARGKAAAKSKFDVYPSAYANMYASAVCSGKVKPGGKKKNEAYERLGSLLTEKMKGKKGARKFQTQSSWNVAPAMRDASPSRTGKAAASNKLPAASIQKRKDEAKSPAWQRSEGKNPEGGLNAKGVASYRAANPGSKLKTAVTTKPSKLKKGSKRAKRRKSFCARMGGMKRRLTSAKTASDPNSRINKALRKWNC